MGPSGCKEGRDLIVFQQDLDFSPTERERGVKVWKIKGEMSKETERDGRLEYFFAATSLVPDNGPEVIAGAKSRWPPCASGCDCKLTLPVGSGSDLLSLIGLYFLTPFAFHIQLEPS